MCCCFFCKKNKQKKTVLLMFFFFRYWWKLLKSWTLIITIIIIILLSIELSQQLICYWTQWIWSNMTSRFTFLVSLIQCLLNRWFNTLSTFNQHSAPSWLATGLNCGHLTAPFTVRGCLSALGSVLHQDSRGRCTTCQLFFIFLKWMKTISWWE